MTVTMEECIHIDQAKYAVQLHMNEYDYVGLETKSGITELCKQCDQRTCHIIRQNVYNKQNTKQNRN